MRNGSKTGTKTTMAVWLPLLFFNVSILSSCLSNKDEAKEVVRGDQESSQVLATSFFEEDIPYIEKNESKIAMTTPGKMIPSPVTISGELGDSKTPDDVENGHLNGMEYSVVSRDFLRLFDQFFLDFDQHMLTPAITFTNNVYSTIFENSRIFPKHLSETTECAPLLRMFKAELLRQNVVPTKVSWQSGFRYSGLSDRGSYFIIIQEKSLTTKRLSELIGGEHGQCLFKNGRLDVVIRIPKDFRFMPSILSYLSLR